MLGFSSTCILLQTYQSSCMKRFPSRVFVIILSFVIVLSTSEDETLIINFYVYFPRLIFILIQSKTLRPFLSQFNITIKYGEKEEKGRQPR